MLSAIAFPFLISFLVAIVMIPSIIKIADLKHLMDEPDSTRKFHPATTPTLGGIAIFGATVFSFSFFNDYLSSTNEIKFMTSGLILLFFAGIQDDIMLLTPLKKLTIQMISALLITLIGKLYLTNLWGMFGITEIPPVLGIFFTFFTIVGLINAFNLIDGINGLAGGLGLLASLFLGGWFYLTDAYSLSILSFALSGALLGFLFFNFHRGQIFMGDTGSMIIGFIISILIIKFIENNRSSGIENSIYYIKAAPGVAIAVVLLPLFDMIRIVCQRILSGQHPFQADRRHIHHLLVDLGWSHTKVCLVLYLCSMLIIAFSLYLRELRSMTLVMILIAIYLLLTYLIFLQSKFRGTSIEKSK